MMSTTEWQDDFIESYVQIGVEQGPEQLDRWFERALTAASADEVFKADDEG
jgi:hypothetical protein